MRPIEQPIVPTKILLPFAVAMLLVGFQPAISQNSLGQNQVEWRQVSSSATFAIAKTQKWKLPSRSNTGQFVFSAARFHLGHFRLKLIGIADLLARNRDRIASSQNLDAHQVSLLSLGLKGIYNAKPFETQRIAALTGAGFPAREQKPLSFWAAQNGRSSSKQPCLGRSFCSSLHG